MDDSSYRYFVVSYMASAESYYTKYSDNPGHSSQFHQMRLYSKDEVIAYIVGLELDKAIEDNYFKMDFLWLDHYVYTQENLFGPRKDEDGNYIFYDGPALSDDWEKVIISRVNKALKDITDEKEAARLAKAREAVIMKEQEEQREYERLSKKFGGQDYLFKNI